MKNKPTVKDKGFKKTYHCPNCKTCVGQENSGIKFGRTPICPNCKLKLDWSEVE